MAFGDVAARAKLRVERARADHGAVDITIRTFRRFSEDDGGFFAASLTYYTFFSIFPLLIFGASALGYLTFLSRGLQERLLEEGLGAVPLISEVLDSESIQTLQEQRGTLALVGLLLALYTGSGAITALEHALNKIHRVLGEPGPIARRLRSLKWLAAAGLAVLKLVGGWYLARSSGSREQTFGAFNTAAALLVASYLLAQITLLAAELNAVLAERRVTRQSAVDRALHPPRSPQRVPELRSMI